MQHRATVSPRAHPLVDLALDSAACGDHNTISHNDVRCDFTVPAIPRTRRLRRQGPQESDLERRAGGAAGSTEPREQRTMRLAPGLGGRARPAAERDTHD